MMKKILPYKKQKDEASPIIHININTQTDHAESQKSLIALREEVAALLNQIDTLIPLERDCEEELRIKSKADLIKDQLLREKVKVLYNWNRNFNKLIKLPQDLIIFIAKLVYFMDTRSYFALLCSSKHLLNLPNQLFTEEAQLRKIHTLISEFTNTQDCHQQLYLAKQIMQIKHDAGIPNELSSTANYLLNLSNLDLSKLDLSELAIPINFRNSTFRGATISKFIQTGCDCEGAIFINTGAKFKLSVTTPRGYKLSFFTKTNHTVKEIKKTIHAELGDGFPISRQKLLFGQQVLNDDKTLGSYHIDEKSDLKLNISIK